MSHSAFGGFVCCRTRCCPWVTEGSDWVFEVEGCAVVMTSVVRAEDGEADRESETWRAIGRETEREPPC